MSQGYAVIYSVEQASSIQILKKMKQSDILPDAEDYIQNRRLIIVDENTVRRQKTPLNATQLADLLFSTALEARRKSGAKRVVVLCNSDILLENGDYAKQADFEQTINHKFDESENRKEQVEIICCYNPARMQKLNLQHLIPIVNAHGAIVGKEWNYNQWYPSTVMEIITRGMEKSLDPLTAELIIKTLKLVYKIDKDAIISNPALFEETLQKIIGHKAADAVLASIAEEVRRRIISAA